MKKDVYTIKHSRKGYILYENGIQIDTFRYNFGFTTLESVVKHLEKYDKYVFDNLDI
jgi:hypothetical protein